MYCPKCGQQQIATDLKFCSRCGFPMAGVIHLLSSGGLLPQSIPEQATLKGLSPRQKGQRQGAMMMLLTLLLVPLMAIITVNLGILPKLFVPLTAVVLFVGGLLRIVYAGLFEEPGANRELSPGAPTAYVPPYMAPRSFSPPKLEGTAQQGIPVTAWQRPRNTAELATPPSVTENTTRLLNQEPEAK
jgi:hypothetical protein